MAEGNVGRGGIKEETAARKRKGERTVNKNATQPINFKKRILKKGRGGGSVLP